MNTYRALEQVDGNSNQHGSVQSSQDSLDKRSNKKKNKLGTLGRLFSKKEKGKTKDLVFNDLPTSPPLSATGNCVKFNIFGGL